MKIRMSNKYKPLFKACAGKLPEVDTIVITGGRDSAKSFSTSLAIADATANHNHRALYTRYTLTSANDSIIPDFTEKIEILGYENYFHVTKGAINCTHNKGKIVFKGIKAGSGNQTANLKSLKDFSMFICEEAEEYPSFEEWDKIQLSIRAVDVQPLNIIILNPTSKKHWIYINFFENLGVKEGFNGIKDNVLYIHTTYLDLDPQFIAKKNLRKYNIARNIYEELEKMDEATRTAQSKYKRGQHSYYKHVVLGGWITAVAGVIYKEWTTFSDWLQDEPIWTVFGLDWGFSNDPLAFVECRLYKSDENNPDPRLYVKQHVYGTGISNRKLVEMVNETLGKELDDTYVVADSSEPKSIEDVRELGLTVIGAKKGAGSIRSGIKKIQGYELHIHRDSEDLKHEANHYHEKNRVNSKGESVIDVIDADNHAMDAMRYASNFY